MLSDYLFLFHLQLLELWCTVPASTTPCPWFTWYILHERFVSLDCLTCSILFLSDIYLSFTYSSCHHKGTTWRLCWAGETCSWVWGLWVQRVWHFLSYLASYFFWISLHFLFRHYPPLQIWIWLEQRWSNKKPFANTHNCHFNQDALLARPGAVLFKCVCLSSLNSPFHFNRKLFSLPISFKMEGELSSSYILIFI